MKNKKVVNATRLLHDDIQFKSKLELYCYNKLKEANLNFKYEEDTFLIFPSFEFKNKDVEVVKKKGEKVFTQTYPKVRSISYTPDFTNLKDGWIIECKGFPNESWPLRWKLFKKHIVDNDLNYDLYVPRNRKQIEETIKLIIESNESIS